MFVDFYCGFQAIMWWLQPYLFQKLENLITLIGWERELLGRLFTWGKFMFCCFELYRNLIFFWTFSRMTRTTWVDCTPPLHCTLNMYACADKFWMWLHGGIVHRQPLLNNNVFAQSSSSWVRALVGQPRHAGMRRGRPTKLLLAESNHQPTNWLANRFPRPTKVVWLKGDH